jgi:uncharacterized membrane protein YeiH
MSDSPGVRFQDPLLGNSSPWVYVCTMWALVACTSFVSIRLWARRMRYGFDDAICLLCFVRMGFRDLSHLNATLTMVIVLGCSELFHDSRRAERRVWRSYAVY